MTVPDEWPRPSRTSPRLEETVRTEGVEELDTSLMTALELRLGIGRRRARDALGRCSDCSSGKAITCGTGTPSHGRPHSPSRSCSGPTTWGDVAGRPGGASSRGARPTLSRAPLADLSRIPRPRETSHRASRSGDFGGGEPRRPARRLRLRRQDGGGVGPPDRRAAPHQLTGHQGGVSSGGGEPRRPARRLRLRRRDRGGVGPPDRRAAARSPGTKVR